MINIYDKAYFDKYIKLAQTSLAEQIHTERWRLIEKYIKTGTILDYGCGPNTFNSYGPKSFDKYGYDVNPHCHRNNYPSLEWAAITFWDSLEHIPNFYGIIQELKPKWLFLTTPNLESVKTPVEQWKHYRPHEHIYYFDRYSLKVILEDLGYEIKEINFDEGRLRNPADAEAIITVVAKYK